MRYILEDIETEETPLEITSLMESKDKARETGDYDELKDKVKDLVEEKKEVDMGEVVSDEEPTDGESQTEEAPGETGEATGDEETEPAAESEPDEEKNPDSEKDEEVPSEEDDKEVEDKQKDSDGKRQTPVTESLRSEYYDRELLTVLVAEDFYSTASTVKNGLQTAGIALVNFAKVLFELGIKYSPVAAKHIKRATIYLFTRSAKLFLKLTVKASEQLKEMTRSTSKLNSQIEKLKQEVARLKESSVQEGAEGLELRQESSNDSKMISWFTVSDKTDPALAAKVILGFSDDMTSQLQSRISNDLENVRRLITLSERNLSGNPLSMLTVNPLTGSFLRRRVEGHVKDPDLVDGFVYNNRLPDNILFVANLPKPGLGNIEDITRAYHESGVFLTTDGRHSLSAEKVDYMDIAGIESFLDVLGRICDNAKKHRTLYTQIGAASEKLKFGYKHYYQKLSQGDREKQTLEDLMEYVYLKQNFVSRVYLPAAMDIHDYTTAFLVRGIKFAKDNLSQLQVKQKESAV